MGHMQRKSLREPDETRPVTNGRADIWELGDFVVGRMTFDPGWRWSVDVKPIAKTEWCEYHHIGIMQSGRIHFLTPDGLEMEVGPDTLYEILPGHDAWVVGDEPAISYDFAGMRTFARPPEERGERVLATLVCTDVVDSTITAERLGPDRWKDMLADLNAKTERAVDRYRGRIVSNTGDGLIALFDGAERAVRAGGAISALATELGVGLRVGVHSGEVEIIPDNVRGVSIHVLSRITGLAAAGEVLVSGTTHELVSGTDLQFTDRGTHELKGVARPYVVWRLESRG